MNFDKARYNMVEQQVRPWNVLDQRILNLMSEIHREDFVPESYRELAYSDSAIPLEDSHGYQDYLPPPREVGRILQALNIQISDHVLEVGSGCGYLTVMLAKLANNVDSLGIVPHHHNEIKSKLKKLNISNVSFIETNSLQNYELHKTYDVICIAAALYEKPSNLLSHLNFGGRLIAIIGNSPNMQATLFTRIDETQFREKIIYETDVPYLKNLSKPSNFKF